MNNWALLTINKYPLPTSVLIVTTTNNPVHLTLHWTPFDPQRHRISRTVRGVTSPWGAYWCFVASNPIEQIELGDTLTHTFVVPQWSFCQTNYFNFKGTVTSTLSPSSSPIFKYHHPGATPHIEEQLLYDGLNFVLPTRPQQGQRLTVTNRVIGKLAFTLQRWGPGWPGQVSFAIRRVSDNSVITTQVWGNEADIPPVPTLLEVTLDTPAHINEEVRLIVDWPTAQYHVNNNLRFYLQTTDVKANEIYTMFQDGIWLENWPWDAAYRYTYYT